MKIDLLGRADGERVVAAGRLFDGPATAAGATRFLRSGGHHLLVASIEGEDVGFVTGVETTHPDKGTEMLLYELGVDRSARGKGVGAALVDALRELAIERGCYGMWAATEADNDAALATYRAAGAEAPEPGVTLGWTF